MPLVHGESLTATLLSASPAPELAGKLRLYGRFVGDWEMESRYVLPDGREHRGPGEIHFGWALEGRAVLDVWILPGIFYGSTLRVYDPGLDAWHILWSDPHHQLYMRQIGREQGDRIVQEGAGPTPGSRSRWSFNDITPDSFLWRGESAPDADTAFAVHSEYRARRVR